MACGQDSVMPSMLVDKMFILLLMVNLYKRSIFSSQRYNLHGMSACGCNNIAAMQIALYSRFLPSLYAEHVGR